MRKVAEQTRQLNEQSRQRLDAQWQNRRLPPVQAFIEKSGVSEIVGLAERSSADELRCWLKHQRCRVGPVFENAGRFAFYVYKRRHLIGDLIAKHGGYQVVR